MQLHSPEALIELAALGLPTREIATRTGLRPLRVRQLLSRAYRERGLRSRLELAHWWWRHAAQPVSPERRAEAQLALSALRPSERRVTELLAVPLNCEQMAQLLGCTAGHVRGLLGQAEEVMGVRGRVALARLVWDAGIGGEGEEAQA